MAAGNRNSLETLRAAMDRSRYAAGAERLERALGRTRLDDRLGLAAGELLIDEAPGSELLALFRVGLPVPRARLAREFPALDVDAVAAAGLIELRDVSVVPRVRIDLLEGNYVACDRESDSADVVTGVSPATRTTAAYLPRRPSRSAWDLGTGAGMLAVLAAGFSGRVVGTDVSGRALLMARVNAELNGLTNIELRRGSFFDPVDGDRFDLVVANPPYVISPVARYAFRDAGLDGDDASRMVLRRIPGLLEPGGIATMQVNWVHGADEPWFAVVDGLLRGSGCDALVVRISTENPLEYAYFWSAPQHDADPGAFTAETRAWHRGLLDAGVQAISTGVVVVRRRDDDRAPTRVAVTMRGTPSPRIGDRLEALFDVHQRLVDLDDDGLLGLVVRAAPELVLHRRVAGPGRTVAAASAPSQHRAVTAAMAEILVGLGDGRPFGTAGRPIAAELRTMLKLGFVEPA